MNPTFVSKKNEEEEKLSPYWAGRRKQEERDARIAWYVDTERVLTVELLVGLLDMPPTPSSTRIVEARLQRLVQLKYVRQIRKGYTTYYVSPFVIKKGDPQLEHKLQETYAWIAFQRSLPVEHRLQSNVLAKLGGQVKPDGAFVTKRHGFCLEIDTGLKPLGQLEEKAHKYLKHADQLQDTLPGWLGNVDSLQVLFITKLPGRVPHIVDKLKGIGSGGMFLVTSQDQFKPFDGSILTPSWRSPRDNELHTLLEEFSTGHFCKSL